MFYVPDSLWKVLFFKKRQDEKALLKTNLFNCVMVTNA